MLLGNLFETNSSAAVISGVIVASTMLRTSFQTTGSCHTATRGREVNVTNTKHVHLVDLGERFPTSIYLQILASIQPRKDLEQFYNNQQNLKLEKRSKS